MFYSVADLLEECGFAGLGRGNDEAARTETDRAEEINETIGGGAIGVFECHSRLRVDTDQVVEGRLIGVFIRFDTFDGKNTFNDGAFFSVLVLVLVSVSVTISMIVFSASPISSGLPLFVTGTYFFEVEFDCYLLSVPQGMAFGDGAGEKGVFVGVNE